MTETIGSHHPSIPTHATLVHRAPAVLSQRIVPWTEYTLGHPILFLLLTLLSFHEDSYNSALAESKLQRHIPIDIF